MIKAVLFDLGNTLVYMKPEETLQKILKSYGIVKSLGEVKQAMVKAQEFDIEKHCHLPAHEFYTQWNMLELKHLGITDKAEARKLAEEVNFQWFDFAKIYVYTDVKKTLQRLKQRGLKLGLVTGGYEEDIEKILPKAGLERFFDASVGVNTTGKRKPHPKAFKSALKRLGIKPHEAIFIGDDLAADYLGAEKAGLIPVLIKREGSPASDVRTIKRLDEIFEVLDEIKSWQVVMGCPTSSNGGGGLKAQG